jgi:hypothetical protein
MQVTVVVPGDGDAVRSFAEWCRTDPELRGVRIKQTAPSPRPGEMGSVADALEFVSNNDALLTAVATTLGTWLATRRPKTKIRVRLGDKEIEIDSPSPEKASELAGLIVEKLEKGPPR